METSEEFDLARDVSSEILTLWPALVADFAISAANAGDGLPADDVDLAPFSDTAVPCKKKGGWSGRSHDVREHFHKLLPEFGGKPHVLHLLACTIVVIRKTKNRGPGIALFHRILREELSLILTGFNGRWLTSVADTLADVGESDAQRALGLCGTVLANTVKLAETERHIFEVPRPWPPKARFEPGGRLYDGTIAFWTEKGDMVDNLLERIDKSQDLDRVGGAVVREIMGRMFRYNTIYSRMDEIHGKPHPPDISDEIRARFHRLARKWL